MRLERLESSCGVGEFAQFQGATPEAMITYLAQHALNLDDNAGDCECDCTACQNCEFKEDRTSMYGLIIWTDRATGSPGQFLAAALRRKRYGTIVETAAVPNPNSDNNIKVWSWTPSKSFLKMAAKT